MWSLRLGLITRLDGGYAKSKDNARTWTFAGRLVTAGKFKASRLFVLKDGTIVCVCMYRGLSVFVGRNAETSWSGPISLDAKSYGYPGGLKLADDILLVSYCSSGCAPNRVHLLRFRVSAIRDGVELLAIDSTICRRSAGSQNWPGIWVFSDSRAGACGGRCLWKRLPSSFEKNVVQSRSFADMLQNAVNQYHSRAITTQEVIEHLNQIAKEMRDAGQRGEKLGLNDDETAFYDALAANESAVDVMGNEQLAIILDFGQPTPTAISG